MTCNGNDNRLPSPEALLRGHGLRAKKGWGQSFLRDPSVSDRIVAALEPEQGDRIVELGAGLGHLTVRLAKSGAHIVAVERDRDLVPVLNGLFPKCERVRVVAADAKTLDFADLRGEGPKLLVAGNLPYHLTTPILFNLLHHREHLARAVMMVQKEVAERLASEPDCKSYGVLSVQTQMWSKVRVVFDVQPGSFHPSPSVVSSVVRLDFREGPLSDPGDPELFRRIVRGAFAQRRKTLRNALKATRVVPVDHISLLLEKAGLAPEARAETVSVEGFARLSRIARVFEVQA